MKRAISFRAALLVAAPGLAQHVHDQASAGPPPTPQAAPSPTAPQAHSLGGSGEPDASLTLQDHSHPARYRNMWVRRLAGYDHPDVK